MKPVKFINSLTTRVLLVLIGVSIAVALATVMVQLSAAKTSIYDRYSTRVSIAARLAASSISGEDIDYYLFSKDQDEKYAKLLDTLRFIQTESGMSYVYITQIVDGGEVYVFDVDTQDPLAIGEFYNWEASGLTESYQELLIKGERLDAYIANTVWGEFLTAREPILRQDGTVAGYAGANFDLGTVLDSLESNARNTIGTTLIILVVSVLANFYIVYRLLTVPLKVLTVNISEMKIGSALKPVLENQKNELSLLESTLVEISESNVKMVKEIDYRSSLLSAVNESTVLMLNLGMESFEQYMKLSVKLIAESLEVDSIYLWKNKIVDGKTYYYKVFEWSTRETGFESGKLYSYEKLPGWEDILSGGKTINNIVKNLSPIEQEQLGLDGVLSVLVIPIFIEGQFWGFGGYDDCQRERYFTKDEETILITGSLLIANAFIRHEMIGDMKDTSEKLEGTSNTLESIMNGIDSMLLVTDPKTSEILFVNHHMKQHYNIDDSCLGKVCHKVFYGFDEPCSFCPRSKLNEDLTKVIVWEYDAGTAFYRKTDRYITWPDGRVVNLQHSMNITDLRAVEQELLAAKDLAEESNRAKSIFLASMSHEIRTPMNAILGVAEIQMQSRDLTPEVEEAMRMIYDSGNLLLNIVNDILDLSKIEAGKLELAPVKYDIPSIINDTVQVLILRYESKPIDFKLDIDPEMPLYLNGDELRIKQILNNIISNSFKYTDIGEIILRMSFEQLKDDDINLIISVTDTGQGMSEDQLSRLFDEYSRFNMQKNRSTVGTGLGLSITKRLIDMMQGEVHVESEPGKGTVFTVYLPQKQIGSEICGTELAEKMNSLKFQKVAEKREPILYDNMSYGKVLIVDDVKTNLYVAKGLLIPYQLAVTLVESGFEAVELIKRGKEYDIIFMDHMMPYMDGIETVKQLRELGYKKPIVALTANALTGQAALFLSSGFDGFMSKPIDTREMNLILNKMIRDKRASLLPEGKVESTLSVDSELMGVFVEDALDAVLYLESFSQDREFSLDEYITVVHGIKSALTNIGVPGLFRIAADLEDAGKRGERDKILVGTPKLVLELKELIQKYN